MELISQLMVAVIVYMNGWMIYLPIKAQNTSENTTGLQEQKDKRRLLLQLFRNKKIMKYVKYNKRWTQEDIHA